MDEKKHRIIKHCCICARQIVSYACNSRHAVGGGRVIAMGFGKVACNDCSRDLDENGLFPEERHA